MCDGLHTSAAPRLAAGRAAPRSARSSTCSPCLLGTRGARYMGHGLSGPRPMSPGRARRQGRHSGEARVGMEEEEPPDEHAIVTPSDRLDCYPYTFSPLLLLAQVSTVAKLSLDLCLSLLRCAPRASTQSVCCSSLSLRRSRTSTRDIRITTLSLSSSVQSCKLTCSATSCTIGRTCSTRSSWSTSPRDAW